MDTTIGTILAIIGAVGGLAGIAAFFRIRSQNEVDEATATEAIQKAALALIEPLQKRIEELERKIEEQESEIEDVRGWAERLVEQVKCLGGVPVQFVRRKSGRAKG